MATVDYLRKAAEIRSVQDGMNFRIYALIISVDVFSIFNFLFIAIHTKFHIDESNKCSESNARWKNLDEK